MDSLFEQIANISKAGAFDVISEHRNQLLEENKKLKDYISYVDGKVEIDELPLSFDQWEDFEKSINNK